MNIIDDCLAEVEQETNAPANNSDVSTSTDNSVLESGGEEEDQKRIRYFSRELATRINRKRPDVTAAMILYGLWLWQRQPVWSFSYTPMVNGERGCYRSLSELQKDYPWLTEEAIRKGLNRAEKALKDGFVIDRSNPDAERGKLHFWISPNIIKRYGFNASGKKGYLAVTVQDVIDYGMVEAVLIRNLEHITAPKRNSVPVKDDQGRIYRELSPNTLTKPRAIGMASKAHPSLVPQDGNGSVAPSHRGRGLHRTHKKKGFYCLKGDEETVTKVADVVTKVASGVSKVASAVTKVARQDEVVSCKVADNKDLCSVSETSITNTGPNPYSNTTRKCLFTETAPLRGSVPVLGGNISVWCQEADEHRQ